MEQDGGFRNFLIGSSEMDELSQSLNYLGHPLMDWLVLFDPENWPESKSFGVMLDSSKKTCQRSKSKSGIERHVVFPRNSIWSRPILVIKHNLLLSIILVASSLPPNPVSIIFISLGFL